MCEARVVREEVPAMRKTMEGACRWIFGITIRKPSRIAVVAKETVRTTPSGSQFFRQAKIDAQSLGWDSCFQQLVLIESNRRKATSEFFGTIFL
jgi:hypothetical protein